jgi:hypothetical protein
LLQHPFLAETKVKKGFGYCQTLFLVVLT